MVNCNPAPSPMATQFTPRKDDNDLYCRDKYLRLLGMINYIAINTRPDLLYAMSRLTSNARAPTMRHATELMRVIRYLKGTSNMGITYSTSVATWSPTLVAHADASFDTHTDHRSQSGYTFSLGDNNGTIYSKSGKQGLITLSSSESEYVSLFECGTEVLWLRMLLADFGFPQLKPTTVFEDNMSTIKIAHGSGNHQRIKHIDLRYHYTRELINTQKIRVTYKPTDQMVADILTKALQGAVFEKIRKLLLNM